ncbi:16S rRNA (guanine(527)-N(7))-methyltransferase RsmG [Actinomadura rudentiformis]|uniref:Ribosomal RNA small subunit methyltransferase G n=1 Tax=Actinomadura rudentiformis TaxID=359158 RepID=A0A6H9YJU8_9ACTN|nr:16S rRNA (guanine(527)-N(7))-methyltransferase RsmG [Actinomadura rudentiformis]KAB2344683.1 16S rRNA (guanine(527)-N(7))-methyltransferase RsmG [Actinomadura rudentiformis]
MGIASEVFGDALPLAERYAEFLADAGVERGLIGPREVDRLWERHLINCAVVEEAIPEGAEVVDIGSGAGLPGIVLAIVRPDLSITLLEPLLRRTTFLNEVVEMLELENVEVRRGRAEEAARELSVDIATARAVAPLERLAKWALPLLRPGGELLAMKGERAATELEEAQPVLKRFGVRTTELLQVGRGKVEPPTTLVRVVAEREPRRQSGRGRLVGKGDAKRSRKRSS